MRRFFALLIALVLAFSLTACGGGSDDKAPDAGGAQAQPEQSEQQTQPEQQEQNIPDEGTDTVDLSGYFGTKTGKFYSQFADGRMYMEYEMEMDGQKMVVISATDGGKTYSETKMDGVSLGVSIMDGEDMYTIDHAGKMIVKMSLGATAQTIAGAVLEESDVDMGDYISGTREIDGKTYDTEEWIVEGAASIMCFDGDDLAYMIGVFEGEEMIMKINKVSKDVDDSLFKIPADYTVIEM